MNRPDTTLAFSRGAQLCLGYAKDLILMLYWRAIVDECAQKFPHRVLTGKRLAYPKALRQRSILVSLVDVYPDDDTDWVITLIRWCWFWCWWHECEYEWWDQFTEDSTPRLWWSRSVIYVDQNGKREDQGMIIWKWKVIDDSQRKQPALQRKYPLGGSSMKGSDSHPCNLNPRSLKYQLNSSNACDWVV